MGERVILPTVLYVITTDEMYPSKLGISQDLELRLSSLQVGNWNKLKVHKAFFVLDTEGRKFTGVDYNAILASAQSLETACHRKLRELELHISGEWFDLEASDADAVVQKVASTQGYRLASPHDILAFNPESLIRTDDILTWRHLSEAATVAARFMAV